jgi:hypothetical protein
VTDRCEYNPTTKSASYGGEMEGDCENEAVLSVGNKPNWHLCESCAALPQFKRFRSRTPLRRASQPTGDA